MPIEDVDYLKQNSIKQNYTFLIDSKDRDYNAWPTPSEYTLTIDPPFPNVVGFQLLESTIPKTMYNVDVNNNKFVFYIHDTTIDITMIHTSNYTGADGSRTIDIGDYSIQTLIVALNGTINNDPTQPFLLEMHVNNDPNKPKVKITVESLSTPPDSKNTLKFSCPYPFVFDMQHTTIAESLGFDLYPQTATESQKLPLQQRYTSFVANYFYTSNNGSNYTAPINNPRLYHSVDLDPSVSLGSEYDIFTGPTGSRSFNIGNIVVDIPTDYTSNISPASSNIVSTSNIIITSNITTSNVIPSSNITFVSNVISAVEAPIVTKLQPSLNITISSNIKITSNITYISNIQPASNITYTSNIVTTSNIVIILNIIPNTSNITFTSFTTISSNMLPESSSITTYSNIVLNSNIIYTSNIKSALGITNTSTIFTTSNIVIISNIIPSTCNIITSLNTTFNSEILPIPGIATNTINIIINSNLTITSNIISALNITTTSNIITTSNISITVNTIPPASNITITSNLIITTNILPVDNTTITSNITIDSNITIINTSNITPAVNKEGTSNQPTTEYNYAVQSFTVKTISYLTQLGAALSFTGNNNLITSEFAYWSLYTNYSDVIYNSSYASNFGIIPPQIPPVFSSSIDGLNDNYPYSLINISNLNLITNKYDILASSNAIGVTLTNGGYSFTNKQFQVKLLPGTYWIVITSPTPGIGIYLNPITKYYTPYNPFISIQTLYFNPAISTLSNLWDYTTHNQPYNGIYYQASMQILLKDTYHYLIAPGIYSLIGERYVVVRCPQIETHSFRSLSYTKHSLGLGKVNLASIGYNQTTADFRSVDIRNFHPIGRLSKLTFRFETIAGNLYDFKGINHTLTCVVYYYEPTSTKTFTQSILNPNYNGDFITYYNNTIEPEEDSDDENLPKYDYKNIENRHLPDSVQRIDQEALYRFSFDPDKE